MPKSPKVYLLLGPPGSGKSTYARHMMKCLGIKKRFHVGWFVATSGKKKFDKQTRRGSFVPKVSHDFLRFVKYHAGKRDCILDGFPRSMEQAKTLLKFYDLEQIFLIHVSPSAEDLYNWSLERQMGRSKRRGEVLDKKQYEAKIRRYLRYEKNAIDWLKDNLLRENLCEIDSHWSLEEGLNSFQERILALTGHNIVHTLDE